MSKTQPSIQVALRSLESGGSDLAQGVIEDVCLSMRTLKLLGHVSHYVIHTRALPYYATHYDFHHVPDILLEQ